MSLYCEQCKLYADRIAELEADMLLLNTALTIAAEALEEELGGGTCSCPALAKDGKCVEGDGGCIYLDSTCSSQCWRKQFINEAKQYLSNPPEEAK